MTKADFTSSFISWAKANVVVPASRMMVSPSLMYSNAAAAMARFASWCRRVRSRNDLLKRLRWEKVAPPNVRCNKPSASKLSKSLRIVTTLTPNRSANSLMFKTGVSSKSLTICWRRGSAFAIQGLLYPVSRFESSESLLNPPNFKTESKPCRGHSRYSSGKDIHSTAAGPPLDRATSSACDITAAR